MATTKKTNTQNEQPVETKVDSNSNIDIKTLIQEALKTQQEEFNKKQEELNKVILDLQSKVSQQENNGLLDFESEKNLRRKVKVKSVYHGGIGHITQGGRTLIWNDYGDTLLVTIEDLINMKSSAPSLLENPSLKILDEGVADYLGLTELYEIIKEAEDLNKLFSKDFSEIETIIKRLPSDFKTDMANEVCLMAENDEIDSGRLKRFLQKELKVDLGLKTT